MGEIVGAAISNLLTPMVLFFALGLAAALLRSDLDIPESIGKALSIYLMAAIGFRGGAELAHAGLGPSVAASLAAAVLVSFLLPVLGFGLLRLATRLDRETAAAVAAHYGSVSVVTFVTTTEFLAARTIPYEGHLVAMMALMETPAIISGLILARTGDLGRGMPVRPMGLSPELVREILVNGSIVLLVGGFVIGLVTGEHGLAMVAPFMVAPFKGILCLFLLEMGLLAARRLRQAKALSVPVVLFGLYMPVLGGLIGIAVGTLVGLGLGGRTLFAVLGASGSYIAVPAAMRLAVPRADPGIYITLSLAVTFPFNILVGIPLYHALAGVVGN